MSRRRSALAAAVVTVGSFTMLAGVQLASAAPAPKVQLCHTNPNHTNLIKVNGNGLHGHLGNPGEQGNQPAPDAVLVDGKCVATTTTVAPETTTTDAPTTTTTGPIES